MISKRFFLASSAVAAFYSAPLYAQDAPAASPQVAEQAPSNTNEIVVTARRREESLSRVPVAISAFSQDTLAQKSISSIDQLSQSAPGLTYGRSGGSSNPQIVIRGQSRANIGDAAQPVLTYFADVPLPFVASILPTYDLGSVQVLKGPQGTLFGRNSTSGAVLVYPQTPTYDLEGYLMGGYGNYNRREAEGAVNVPIVDGKIALRVAGQRIKRDGFTRVVNTGQRRDDANDSSFRVSLLLDPTDTLRNVTVYDYVEWNRAGDAAILNYIYPGTIAPRTPGLASFYDCGTSAACDIDLALAQQETAGVRRTYSDKIGYLNTRVTGLSNTTTLELGDITLKNIFGLRTALTDNSIDTDGSALTMITAENRASSRQITEEVQAQGDFLDGKLQTIVGGFYLKSRPNGRSGLTLASFSPPSRPSVILSYRRETSKAIFGAATYEVIDGLKIDVGARKTWDKTTACAAGYPATFPYSPKTTPLITEQQCIDGTTVAVNGTNVVVQGSRPESKSSALTWNLGVNYQATPDIFLYATLRRGYRAGGVNTPIFSTTAPNSLAPFQSYAPEKVTDAEIGMKAKWQLGDVRGTINVDVFRGTYKGSQRGVNGLTGFDGDGNTANDPSAGTIIINAGKARVQGFDIETTIMPTRSLTFTAFASYNHAKYLSVGLPTILSTTTAFPTDAGDTAFPYAPELTLGGSARYEAELGNDLGTLAFNVDAYRASRIYFGTFKSDATLSQPAYTVVNGRIDWNEIAGSNVSLGLYVRNLFDKDYASGAANSARSAGFNSLFYADPRTYGLQARVTF